MKILQDLLNNLKHDAPIQHMICGVHWTAVLSRACGMASTVMGTKPHGESAVRGAGELENLSAKELAA